MWRGAGVVERLRLLVDGGDGSGVCAFSANWRNWVWRSAWARRAGRFRPETAAPGRAGAANVA